MTTQRYYSVAAATYRERTPEGALIARAVAWLLASRQADGTWGEADALDRFISTTHSLMALLCVGFSPQSSATAPGLRWLTELDPDRQISFFWRAGVLLNLPGYEELVRHDMEYLWRYRRRVGVHKDYPVPFFLLKLLRFATPKPVLTFTESDVVAWILEEWSDSDCWYRRTSITSMAMALLRDLMFERHEEVVTRSEKFLLSEFRKVDEGGHFNSNLVDDCFTVFNLCEQDYCQKSDNPDLRACIDQAAARIASSCHPDGYWQSPPPFGGAVGERIYPTAVAVRALMSHLSLDRPHALSEVASELLDIDLAAAVMRRASGTERVPFWGPLLSEKEAEVCFVLMPFTPPKLTEIYERYVKAVVVDRTELRCMRADDIFKPSKIMEDVWHWINQARVIIADLTNKNANVFYELGLAHAIGKDVILISQSEGDIPFDLRGVRTIIYRDSPRGYEELADTLLGYLRDLGLVIDKG